MPDLAAPSPSDSEPVPDAPRSPWPWPWLVGAGVAALALFGAAWLMVGPAPEPADSGFPKAPPPLALPDGVPEDGALARAAALLATGELEGARRGFTDVVALDREGEAGQVGLVLSRWRSTGPVSVERDLRQLAREYPASALVALHLGMVQALVGEDRASRTSLRDAIELGREAGDPTSLRMARLADDLLHPDAFRGDMPVLVAAAEVAAAERAPVRELLAAVGAGDHERRMRLAAQLERSTDDLVRVAAATATFDKADPEEAATRLEALAGDRSVDAPARDRARMLAALARAWGGGDLDASCRVLRASTRDTVDQGTRRLAGPIAAELCA